MAEIAATARRLFGANGNGAADEALPVAARLAIVYLLLPLAVWLLGWFEWWVGVPVVALLGAGLWRALSGPWRQRIGLKAIALLLFALVCGALTAFGVLDGENWDSPMHRAMLLHLARDAWPVYLADRLSDEPPLLRTYLGYYMVPALVGKWLGLGALNWAVALWTWGGIALVAALAAQGLPTLRATLLAAAVFVLFSGMDALEYILRDGLLVAVPQFVERLGIDGLYFIDSPANPGWAWYHAYGVGDPASWPAPASPMYLEYPSNASLMGFNPHHFIGGGLTTLLVLRLCDQARFLAASGVVLTTCLFWSSLLCIGLLPLVGAMLLKNGIRPFLGWRNVFLAPVLAALLALYLTSGQVGFPRGWLWDLYASGFQLAVDMGIFYVAEFLALALVLWWLRPGLAHEPFLLAAVAVLLAAPWFWYGGPRFNELHRVAIPATFVLAYYAARAVVERLPEVGGNLDGRRWLAADVSERVVFALLVAVLAIGAVTTVFELAKAKRIVPLGRLAPMLLTDFDPVMVAQKTAWHIPRVLSTLLRENAGDGGEPVIRSDYDVYTDGNWLVYARRDCSGEAEAKRRFRLRVQPVDEAAEEAGARRLFGAANLDFYLGYRFNRNPNFRFRTYDDSRGCVVRARLPDYQIARIHTGQHEADGAVLWEAGYDFETKEQFSAPDFPLSEYQTVVAGSPAARSNFDVYFGDGLLAFAKAPCGAEDVKARFIVHLFPVASRDLPANRQPYGFDNLDFDFAEHGVIFDGKCLAALALPDYAIVRVEAGQWLRAESRVLWQVEFATAGHGNADG